MKSQRRIDNDRAIESFIRKLYESGRVGTAVGEAARWGRLKLLREFVASGISVDVRTETGETPLMLAASGGQLAVVKYLIKQGADVNAIGEQSGGTPVIRCLAALHRDSVYLSVCRTLLDAGAGKSLAVRDKDGWTAIDWVRDGRPDEVRSLIESQI